VRETQYAGQSQKAEWFAVIDFVLQTVSQNGTKLTRSAFLVTYRLAASNDKKRGKQLTIATSAQPSVVRQGALPFLAATGLAIAALASLFGDDGIS
jgi:hypothetical protein